MIIGIVAIIVISGSLIYYFGFFRPGIERAGIRLQEQKATEEATNEALRKENLEKCLKEARTTYLEMLLAIEGDTYPMEQYKTLIELAKDLYQSDIDACNMMYGK